MTRSSQLDLFSGDPQEDFFDEDAPPVQYLANPDQVRTRLNRILAEARSDATLPRDRISLYRTIFPQMTAWLPDEEARQLRFEFEVELARLLAA